MRTLIPLLACLCLACVHQPRMSRDAAGMRLSDRLDQADLALREARLLDAEIAYRRLASDHPRLPEVWLRLGNIYVRQDQLDAAVHSYRQGLQRHPSDGRLWYNLALAQLRQSIDTLETASAVLAVDSPYHVRLQALHQRLLQLAAPDHNGDSP